MNVRNEMLKWIIPVIFSCLVIPARAFASDQFVVLMSAEIPYYLEAQEGVNFKLGDRRYLTYHLKNDPGNSQRVMDQVQLVAPKAVIAVGPLAVEAVKSYPVEAPVVFCMVINHSGALKKLPESHGVAFQISPEDSYERVHQLLPRSKIAVLYNPEVTGSWVENLAGYFEGYSLKLISIPVTQPGDIAEALGKNRSRFNALWILPDGSFVDNVTIDYFIRYSLKEKVPLIGFSEGLARSGALISISGNNRKMGEKAVDIMDRVLAGKQKERIEFLKDIKTYLNTKVAELFDISINKTFYALVDRKFPEE